MNLPSIEQIQAEMKRRKIEKQRELAKLAEEHFSDFIPQAWQMLEPNVPLAPNYHIDAIAEHLEATHIGQIKRLVINIPPRMGKTQFVTIMYPAWRWIKLPSTKYINLSYSASLSVAHNVRRRDLIQSDWYRDNWGNIVSLKDDMNRQNRYENTKGGVMFATSIGGTLTGEGADCFIAGTMIMTENGEIPIEKLCSMENPPLVLTFNHKTKIMECKPIVKTRVKKSSDIVSVLPVNNRSLVSTADHKYYTDRRLYSEAKTLSSADGLLSVNGRLKGVAMVNELYCGEVDVYDLQVADNHNFFANGILVHNCIIIDDAHNPKQAESDTERQHAIDFFDGTLQTRLNDPINGVIIIVMQRLHERDLTGHVLAKNLGYEHLCLPMEAQKYTVVKLPISGREIVREKGDLLHAERYSQTVIDEMKASMGSYNWAGQMNQTPVPAGGGMFKKWWWQYYQFEGMDLPPIKQTVVNKEIIDGKVVAKTKDILIYPVTIPSNWAEKKYFEEVSQSWDMAFKSNKDNDFVAGGIWGKKGSGRFMMDLVKRRLSFTETLAEVRKMTAKHPYASRKLVEDKANGPAIIDSLRKEIQGIIPINPGTDSKEARAESTTYMHEAGNVFLPHPMMPGYHWVTDFIENCAKFPKCEHDDDIDQMVQQLNYWKKTNDFLGDAGWY